MISGFIAKKVGMESLFTDAGRRLVVTRLQANPLIVTQVKSEEKDGYQALQFAFGQSRRLDRPTSAKLAKIKVESKPSGFIEFKLTDSAKSAEVGSNVAITDVFSEGDSVSVSGISKGRGFAGVIKRWGFHRQPVSGGQSDRVRAPGSIGAQTPGKVLKGKKMPGHYGNKKISTLGLKVVKFFPETNQVLVSGSVPGCPNSWVIISKPYFHES
ncbi:MAG: 50S ribosomal protein L3 [Candidatus Shapirobacteria bacterium]|jgi:large subunit ribosomal protein L3